jgi:proteasome assembly chaperone 3
MFIVSEEITDTTIGFPIRKTISIHHASNDVTTQVSCASYDDYIHVIISQKNKYGSILIASFEKSGENNKTFHIQNLLGRRDDPLINIYARNIIEEISKSSNKPLMLSICLQDEGRGTDIFQDVMNQITKMQVW